jgi:hypothetical protein
MGAQTFSNQIIVPKNTTDEEAFTSAKSHESHMSGHGGYTGTLAEKGSFVMIHKAKNAKNAERIANHLTSGSMLPIFRQEVIDIVDDKWGPAGAIRYPIDKKQDGLIFFGWASS